MMTDKANKLDERALLLRLESADADELAQMFLTATDEEQKVLRIYLGDARFRRMRNLVLRRELFHGSREGDKKNVVIIPGVLGSQLISVDPNGVQERIWLNPRHIVAGNLVRLRLDDNGLTEADPRYRIKVTGILKRYYGELMLSLAERWNVHAFWYDWRKDFRLAAAELQARINSWFPEKTPVHIVAHAEGGLVARTYIKQYSEHWNENSRLIMLGTPNYGTFAAPQAITGHLRVLHWVDLLDTRHTRSDYRDIVKTFPSLYQLLPAACSLPNTDLDLDQLYEVETYNAALQVPQTHLQSAKAFHDLLKEAPVKPDRMIYLSSHGHPTFLLKNIDKLKDFNLTNYNAKTDGEYFEKAYTLTLNGDGKVPHSMGVLRNEEGKRIPALWLKTSRFDICSNPQILTGLNEILNRPLGKSVNDGTFHEELSHKSGLKLLTDEQLTGVEAPKELKEKYFNPDKEEVKKMETLVQRIGIRGGEPVERDFITTEERDIEENMTRGFFQNENSDFFAEIMAQVLPPPTIKINLVHGDITDLRLYCTRKGVKEELDIDTVAVGHYSGSKPHGIMRGLDIKISKAMANEAIPDDDDNLAKYPVDEAELFLTQFTQRGTIRGELSEPFFMPDPRNPERIIAIAGMGEPGRFGIPELTLLTRELCWTLGRMGKKHLATVLVGTGRKNLSVADAVNGWVRGLKLAITGIDRDNENNPKSLREITFFLKDPRKIIEFDEAIQHEQEVLEARNRMKIEYTKIPPEDIHDYKELALDYARNRMEEELRGGDISPEEQAPTRVTVGLQGRTYFFGAITSRASIPEREIPLDPELVKRANDELMATSDPDHQVRLGQFMERLLIPEDLRSQLSGNAPLVMMVDKATARIHWEMLAQSDITPSYQGNHKNQEDSKHRFLGISRGFTRQLRTTFAPPPDPPPASRRRLRVLVVADPAHDAHLPGAEEEGIVVADLFEKFNILRLESGNYIEVTRLFGPHEATRTAVLRHLMMRTYDVLHFAGHCMYDEKNPTASGWVFSNGERLSANEFTRVDRSPSLVFSNACQSGITSVHSDKRAAELAPSFAESFFARGVTNFICTAWPIDDRAARVFAVTLYANLLGLFPTDGDELTGSSDAKYSLVKPKAMFKAMQEARLAISSPPSDIRTWGAYQHYGNPYFRLFDPMHMKEEEEESPANTESADNHSDAKSASTNGSEPPATDSLPTAQTGRELLGKESQIARGQNAEESPEENPS